MTIAKLKCALCGAKLKDGKWTYSPWTKNHYCPVGKCKIADRKAKDEA